MGYCGLESAGASDTASDFLWTVADAIAKALKKEAKEENGPFNTDGCVNAAFFISEVIYPAAVHAVKEEVADSFFNDKLLEAVKKVKKRMEKQIKECDETQKEEWGDEKNRLMHYNRYKELMEDIDNTIDHIVEINTY